METQDKQLTGKELEQKQKFEQLYKQQEQDRQAQKLKKQELDEQTKDPKEKMLTIQKEFREKHEALSQKIKVLRKENLNIDDLFEDFRQFKIYFVNSNHALTTFDKQQYKDQMDKLETNLFLLRDMVRPRKKFRFTKRVKEIQAMKNEQKHQGKEQNNEKQEDYFDQIQGIQNLENQTLTPSKDELKASFKLYNLKSCKVYLNEIFDNLYIKNLENCEIFVGPVKSSVFVDGCKGCTLNLMGHQLRIHNSYNTTFSIFASSKSIIEHCSGLIFTSYKHTYEGIESHIKESGYSEKENLWKDVQDFNWLKQEQSPNFVIQE